MGVNVVGSGGFSMDAVGFSGGGSDPRLRALEQKLQKLSQEKKKAVQNKDEEKVKRLEQQIEDVKRQIEQLKKKKQKEDRRETISGPEAPSQSPGLTDGFAGAHIDRLA